MKKIWTHGQILKIDYSSKGTKAGFQQSSKRTINNMEKEEG
jgi:hypothetical protein